MKQEIYSAGIDIGTSTTQLIFSKITIENMANAYSVPRISIVDKEVIYRSNIYNTPIIGSTEIDAKKIREIVMGEYQKAGFRPGDLSTRSGYHHRRDGPEEKCIGGSECSQQYGRRFRCCDGRTGSGVRAGGKGGGDRYFIERTGLFNCKCGYRRRYK